MKKISTIHPLKNIVKNTITDTDDIKLEQIYGHEIAKRALIISVAGRHNILLSGPPGTGKTLLASASRSLLPTMNLSEQISATKLHSLYHSTTKSITTRPFRAPHHTASTTSIIGGGTQILPGEISLAHTGILFMDEFPEFKREVIEALREPLESQKITLARNNNSIEYPADFLFIAAMNPCPCGYHGSTIKTCSCTTSQLQAYRRKLSGPFLDRIDMHITLNQSPTDVLVNSTTTSTLTTKIAKSLISDALKCSNNIFTSRIPSPAVLKELQLDTSAKNILDSFANKNCLSIRSYIKCIKVAKTIANLAQTDTILPIHISEALRYRLKLP